MKICKKDDCTGCFACLNACPVEAISQTEDEQGRVIAQIDTKKCIDCGLCSRVCPSLNVKEGKYPLKCYAVKTKQPEDKKASASGGAATGFSREVIKRGGVVFGAAYDKELTLEHRCAGTEEEIIPFRGSKYVQSNVKNTYRQAKKCLESGQDVLYIGTPCQIDGLKHYLSKDYEGLLTVDIVCHGTPPMRYLKEYVKELTTKKIENITFRGAKDFKICLYDKNGEIIYEKDRFCDIYFCAFLHGLIYRENCYTCRYACDKRVSDITIGDFWGLNWETLKNKMYNGISEVLINTDKGKTFFDSIKEEFVYEEREIQEAILGNDQLQRPTTRHAERDQFIEMYKKHGFSYAVKRTSIYPYVEKNRLKFWIKKNILRREV